MAKFRNMATVVAAANGDLDNFIIAQTPGGIQAQKARGQRAFVASETLPIEINYNTREDYESLGFVFGEPIDDLFIRCQFPVGWSKRSTDHSLWTDIVDDKGRKRGSVFYKAAFYDRDAFMSLSIRYYISREPVGGYEDKPDLGRKSLWRGFVRDTATGETIWETDHCDMSRIKDDREYYNFIDALQKRAASWADNNLPDWRNPLAYWGD